MVSTSGSGLLFVVCFVAVVAAALLSVGPILKGRISLREIPAAGWIVWLVVAVPSLLQVPFPLVYEVLYRNASAVGDGRQWWRVGTAIIVQDGGITGTVSNLTLLAVALLVCLPLWGSGYTILTFSLVGIALNIAAVTLGAQDGGGNSGATLALIATLVPLSFVVGSGGRQRSFVGLMITLGAALALVFTDDGHGYAVITGLLVGAAGIPYARARLRLGLIPSQARPTDKRADDHLD